MNDGVPYGVNAIQVGDPLKIEAPIIIGADGVESKGGPLGRN